MKKVLMTLLALTVGCAGVQERSSAEKGFVPSDIRQNLTISGDVTVKGKVKVHSGAVLTVMPGTRIFFEPYDPDGDGIHDSGIVVEGRLEARGNPDAPILLTSAADNPEPGDWLELRLDRSEGTVLEFCVVRYSRYGVHAHFSSGIVADSIFSDNIDATRFGNSRFALVRNSFKGNVGKGINLRRSRILITSNSISGNRHGIFIFEEGAETSIFSNEFEGNAVSDIRLGDFYRGDPPSVAGNFRADGHPLVTAGFSGRIHVRGKDPVQRVNTGPRTRELSTVPLWEQMIGSFVDAAPVSVGEGKIAVASWENGITLIQASDGAIVSRVMVPDVTDATPVYYRGRLYFPSWDRIIRVVDVSTGETIRTVEWGPSPDDDHRQASPLLLNSRIVLGLWSGDVLSMDGEYLDMFWMERLDGAVRGQAAHDGRSFWIGTDTGSLYEMSEDGKIINRLQVGERVRTAPKFHETGDISVVTWQGTLLRVRNGEIVWRRKLPGPGTYAPPVSPGGGHVIVGDGSGTISMYDSDGALRWRNLLESSIHSLGWAAELLWAGTEKGTLAAVNIETGRIEGSLKADGAVHSSPLMDPDQRGKIIWTARDGMVRAHQVKIRERAWEWN